MVSRYDPQTDTTIYEEATTAELLQAVVENPDLAEQYTENWHRTELEQIAGRGCERMSHYRYDIPWESMCVGDEHDCDPCRASYLLDVKGWL